MTFLRTNVRTDVHKNLQYHFRIPQINSTQTKQAVFRIHNLRHEKILNTKQNISHFLQVK